MTRTEWIQNDGSNRVPRHGERVLVVFNPHRKGCKREIRMAKYYVSAYPDGKWFIYGGADDCGYYHQFDIEWWAGLPEMPQGLT